MKVTADIDSKRRLIEFRAACEISSIFVSADFPTSFNVANVKRLETTLLIDESSDDEADCGVDLIAWPTKVIRACARRLRIVDDDAR